MDAHRLSLFNVLGQDFAGERVLDLFAGSGAFALESLSRGAARAVLVERAPEALAAIEANVCSLRPEAARCEVIAADAYALPALGGPFDVVFVAPPYPHFRTERVRLAALLASLPGLLDTEGIVVVQSDAGDFAGDPPPGLAASGRRRWGRTEFTFLRRGG
jgi:16S rRNA (guanine966-N2)-methyltransferase